MATLSAALRPAFNTSITQPASTARFGLSALVNSLNDTIFRATTFQLPDWLGPFLWAVPKKKTSHSKKRMRASNKGLKDMENITKCPACGNLKLMHHLCRHCYQDIKKKAKSAVVFDA